MNNSIHVRRDGGGNLIAEQVDNAWTFIPYETGEALRSFFREEEHRAHGAMADSERVVKVLAEALDASHRRWLNSEERARLVVDALHAAGIRIAEVPAASAVEAVSRYECEHGIQSSSPFSHSPEAYGPDGKVPCCYSRPVSAERSSA